MSVDKYLAEVESREKALLMRLPDVDVLCLVAMVRKAKEAFEEIQSDIHGAYCQARETGNFVGDCDCHIRDATNAINDLDALAKGTK